MLSRVLGLLLLAQGEEMECEDMSLIQLRGYKVWMADTLRAVLACYVSFGSRVPLYRARRDPENGASVPGSPGPIARRTTQGRASCRGAVLELH